MRRRDFLTTVPLLALAACTTSGTATPSGTPTSAPDSTGASEPPTANSSRTANLTTRAASKTTVPTSSVASVAPGVTADPLTGGVPSNNPVMAVKIDNTYFDVPQFGVSDADIVFVELVEGGLTRLIAVFHTNLDVEVGPIRSVRSTDAELLPVFGKPGLVFSGGAGGPLADLAKASILDTSNDNGYFRSDAASGTYNLHADLKTVTEQAVKAGVGNARSIGLTFAASDPRVAAGSAAASVVATFPAATVTLTHSGGRYVNQRDGADVKDYQGRPETADNVLVMRVIDVPDGTVDSVGSPSFLSHTVGNGELTLCRDGKAIAGTWTRKAVADPFAFTDESGQALPFKPGRTWVILLPKVGSVKIG